MYTEGCIGCESNCMALCVSVRLAVPSALTSPASAAATAVSDMPDSRDEPRHFPDAWCREGLPFLCRDEWSHRLSVQQQFTRHGKGKKTDSFATDLFNFLFSFSCWLLAILFFSFPPFATYLRVRLPALRSLLPDTGQAHCSLCCRVTREDWGKDTHTKRS